LVIFATRTAPLTSRATVVAVLHLPIPTINVEKLPHIRGLVVSAALLISRRFDREDQTVGQALAQIKRLFCHLVILYHARCHSILVLVGPPPKL
jgi:hypothetical protein